MRVWWTRSVALLGTCSMILQFLQGSVLAGPVRRSSRMIREVYPEIEPEKFEGNQAEVCIVGDVVYGAEEPVPADQPCLKCKCQPPGVQCETTRCVKKPGCRAIHKPNQCCPEYQCECEHEGKFYANGERLETPPGGECRVCYCRGGEVQCAEVSCYIRTDCEGRTVPGQCCPKYDHCPPREPAIGRVVPYTTQSPLTSNADHLDYWPSPNTSIEEDRLTTAAYDLQEITNEDSNKITESQTEFLPKSTEFQALNDSKEQSKKIHIHETTREESQPNPTNEIPGSNSSQEQEKKRNPENVFPDAPKITIQEIIPEIKEIPITGPPKREINLHSHGLNLDDLEFTKGEKAYKATPTWYQDKENNVSDLALGDAETDSSEISEIYHHPPPVLKIGDQLLFLKKGELVPGKDISTPLPVITIIGAEGLQRGTEDSVEFHEIPSQVQDPHKDETVSENPEQTETTTIKNRNENTHIISLIKSKSRTEDSTQSSISTIEDFLLNLTKVQPTSSGEFSSDGFDANTSMLTETLINKIKSLTNVESTTDVAHLVQKVYIADVNSTDFEYAAENSSTIDPNLDVSTTDEKWYEVKTSEEQHSSTSVEPSVTLLERIESVLPTSTESIDNEDNRTQSSNQSESRYEDLGETKLKHDDDGAPIEQNPEYPPIPDIMSPQNADDLSEHLDTELAQVTSEEPLGVQENNSSITNTSLFSNTTEVLPTENPKEMRILPDVLAERNNATIKNSSYPQLLKNTTNKSSHPLINQKAALPTTILKQVASSDQKDENTTESESAELKLSSKVIDDNKPENQISVQSNVSTESTPSTNPDRSKETLEESTSEESGESTTPQNRHASILLSTEDASVETTHSASAELDLTDLVETISGIQESTEESENKSVEKKDEVHKKTVLVQKDVELIDPKMLLNKTKENITLKNISYENNKRKNIVDEDEDSIFKELNEELKSMPSHVIDNKTGNEDTDAEAIFRELLEEATSSTLPPTDDGQSGFSQPRDKESELLQRVSDAITKFQLKESKESLDTSILGILRDFFSSQYKYYDAEK